MAPQILRLPNGQTLTVTPIFGGLYFKSNDLNVHHADHCPFPPGWTVVINTTTEVDVSGEEGDGGHAHGNGGGGSQAGSRPTSQAAGTPTHTPSSSSTPAPATADSVDKHRAATTRRRLVVHPYHGPTRTSDHIFISSISQPSSAEFRPASSPARHLAMMLWATLLWYFQQPPPDVTVTSSASARTPAAGRPRADWRIGINREGVFKGRQVLNKLQRMGLIATEESCVGVSRDERAGDGWLDTFVSRRAFWQLDARIYLFTLPPGPGSPMFGGTPTHSRPASPSRGLDAASAGEGARDANNGAGNAASALSTLSLAPSGALSGTHSPTPFTSTSHLPTYYPPPPAQYTTAPNGIRHPVRPKPGVQGEVLYSRYIASLGQYLSFRIASLAPTRPHRAAAGPGGAGMSAAAVISAARATLADSGLVGGGGGAAMGTEDSDVDLLHRWMNSPRVSASWGEDGPRSHQEAFLRTALSARHSIPLIGCFDGRPFGYFEVYWAREDPAVGLVARDVGMFERGLHCLVGEEEFRGRVGVWLSSLVHMCWLMDLRTESVLMEPRVDNAKILQYAQEVGFYKEGELSLPHKQANLLRIRRENWEAPAL